MKRIMIAAAALVFALSVSAQDKAEGYKFTDIKTVPTTSVKDQASSGTCWAYSGLSFIENELLRKGKGEYDLSDMWIVRYTYEDKAKKYVRMHGKINFAAGGAAHDNFNVIDNYGIVPEEAYRGLNYGTDKNVHGELDNTLKGYVDAIIRNPNRKLSTAWFAGVEGILDAYLGQTPETFKYKGKEYTPKSFAAELGIKGEDYISLTSFMYKPYHTWMAVEVPDNFAWGLSYNVTLDELMQTIDNAIEKGYSVLWASDVSEQGFKYNQGFAVLPDLKMDDMRDSEKAKWSALTEKERAEQMLKFESPVPEIKVTPELRQEWFDNYQTTDDHGMVIVGVAKDQNGTKYYKVKNSWNTGNVYEGYFYASEEFVKGKTMNIVISREALPFSVK